MNSSSFSFSLRLLESLASRKYNLIFLFPCLLVSGINCPLLSCPSYPFVLSLCYLSAGKRLVRWLHLISLHHTTPILIFKMEIIEVSKLLSLLKLVY